MTPGARAAAAISVLDRWLAGQPSEQALTNWGRASRYAGSGDRAAVRDLVYDAIRCRRSFAHLGGAESGRGLVLGGLRAAGAGPGAIFTGVGHAPFPLTPAEGAQPSVPTGNLALDCPDWLEPALRAALGADFAPVMELLRHRAPLFLRVNTARATQAQAIARLADEGIDARPHPLAATALEVTAGARRVQAGAAFAEGWVEVQDAASQAVVAMLPLRAGLRVLDLCAGGGGKTLAMAAMVPQDLFAHDADPRRMTDLPRRATRAGARVTLLPTDGPEAAGPFGLVLADVPCSGSGSWRRAPEAKWALTPGRLADLCALQSGILDRAARLVAPGGHLAFATCSMLTAENETQANAFLQRHQGFAARTSHRFSPMDGGDGFFVALFARNA